MNKFKELFMCARPHSFPATFAPIFVGTSFSLFYKINFKIDNFILFLVICLLIQSATNLFNEYYDYKRGLDKIDSQGISASILRKKLSEKEVLNFAKLLYIIALFLGIILSLKTSLYLLAIGILSMVFGYIYTGGKYPIAYTPFGEITAGLFMGSIMVSVSFYLQTGFINIMSTIISIPMFILVGNILLANNIRDNINDKISGRKTFTILFGKKISVIVLGISFILIYLFNIVLIFTKYGSLYNLLIFITLPLSIKIIKGFLKNDTKEKMAPYMVYTAKLTIFSGIIISFVNIVNSIK